MIETYPLTLWQVLEAVAFGLGWAFAVVGVGAVVLWIIGRFLR